MEILIQYSDLLIFLFLVCLGYGAGSFAERRHYRSIELREKSLITLPVVTIEDGFEDTPAETAKLLTGSVVISIDYFKRLLAILRNIFGGRVSSYESLVDRARREAILRMKEQAYQMGADIVINMRLETATIGRSANAKRKVGSVEAIAYGTALCHKRQ